jgi:hypothetical protein
VRPIELHDILGRERYGAARDEIRRRMIVHKRERRVQVGDRLSFVFEDRATVWYQIQEMCWVEQITDLDAIRGEIAVYNQLLPGSNELSATLLIEIEDQGSMRAELNRLIGIDEHVVLEVGEDLRVAATFEEGRQTTEKISAVQYVRFPLPAEACRRLGEGAPIALATTHPAYRERTALSAAACARLAADVTDPAATDAALAKVRDGA